MLLIVVMLVEKSQSEVADVLHGHTVFQNFRKHNHREATVGLPRLPVRIASWKRRCLSGVEAYCQFFLTCPLLTNSCNARLLQVGNIMAPGRINSHVIHP